MIRLALARLNPVQIRAVPALGRGPAVLLCLACSLALAQPGDPDGLDEEVRQLFEPAVVALDHEKRVMRSAVLDAICDSAQQRSRVAAWLARRNTAVLSADQTGLTLHFFAEGIEAMTPADRLWEGLPKRADSLQALVDHAITRSRDDRRPIAHLIITGHAGLAGCCALGGTLDDCVFEGRLTRYQQRQLRRLRPYLADDAEIELRQCVTGKGQQGRRLLTAIHQITGAWASSYLSDFHFGDSAAHPRVRVDADGLKIISP